MDPYGTGTEELRAQVAELIGTEPEAVSLDANLFELGLESIVLMRLVGRFRKQGSTVTFADLAARPTVSAWSELVGAAIEPVPVPTACASESNRLDTGSFDLAVLQHAYWIGRSAEQRFGGVSPHLYTEFDGRAVDPDRLCVALEAVVGRHDMLRARITDNGQQVIESSPGWRGLTVHDLRSADDVAAELERTRQHLTHQMLDIEAGEVFSADLSLLPDGRTRLHLDMDMIAGDAVSFRILVADLAQAYDGRSLPAIGYSYGRYLADRPDDRRSAREQAERYWSARLDSLPGAPTLPLLERDSGSPVATRRAFHLEAQAYSQLQSQSRAHGVTPAVAVAAAFAEVVGAWSREQRFILNVPMFDRAPTHPAVGELVGDFSSSVMLDVDLNENLSFAERSRQLRARLHEDASHVDYSGVEVLRDLGRRRGEPVLAPVVFTSALGLGELFDSRARQVFGDPVWIMSQGPQVVLDAQITELDGGVLVNWDIRENEFLPGVPEAMFDAFETLVRGIVFDDDDVWTKPVGQLAPSRQLLSRTPAADVPRTDAVPAAGTETLHRAFFDRAARTPDATALEWGDDESMTYGQLCDRALRVAAALTDRGVAVGDTVGVTLPKGPDQVTAVLGVLAAGGVYVPIGVDQPASRAALIAGKAGFAVTIGGSGDDGLDVADAVLGEPLFAPHLGPDTAPAYMIFTSGSTGEPKGVVVSHRAAMNTISDLIGRFELDEGYRPLCLSELDFDLCTFDLFSVFAVGGTAVLIEEHERKDPQRWTALIRAHRVTVISCVPPLLDMILSTGEDLGGSLEVVMLGGDKVGIDLYRRLTAAVPGCRFAGLGGATETAIHNSICEVVDVDPNWRTVPFGVPLGSMALRVVDARGHQVPDWVPGELWVAGVGLADGYVGDPERTNERFVDADGYRWYRTGDLVRYGTGSMVEFLGRVDNQIKINGFRIELGEIESVLCDDAEVTSAAAVVDRAGAAVVMAAVVLADGDADPDETVAGIIARAAERLPAHMVPERMVAVRALPLTVNGKIDSAAIAGQCRAAGDTERVQARVAPRTHLERALASVWQTVLGVDEIGVTDTVFALGGDSVLATTIVARTRAAFDITSVTVRMLFAAPTVSGLAESMIVAAGDTELLEATAEIYVSIESMSEDQLLAALDQQHTP
ncbi:amino acid adenylation domain-containing protein [Rhodococcus sp. IEGM 1330]|uniref:non-ribosomal peptide synthetase n=1 Tax=Rhodococcus sp. IEGM 1330 TaxID=3082225 RepID=UPI002953A107|nr:amino acid adenylation domain-containing protein [Rhodococcus sp. IEGM 1330]MDV8022893.1 amino acid adenylation domain-containing protein [Rhodococcus sp. IEGM 1330]